MHSLGRELAVLEETPKESAVGLIFHHIPHPADGGLRDVVLPVIGKLQGQLAILYNRRLEPCRLYQAPHFRFWVIFAVKQCGKAVEFVSVDVEMYCLDRRQFPQISTFEMRLLRFSPVIGHVEGLE